MIRHFVPHGVATALLAAAVAIGVTASGLGSKAATAEPGDLAGSWSGGGSVSFATGKKESARCRASFSKSGGSSYEMNATCATPSGKVSQSASLQKLTANSYSGSFHNAEYNVSGSIRIRVNGNSQSVSLSSDSGSANFQLSRY